MPKESNIAYIDGQNLHLGTKQNNWKVDLRKFRIYLKDKYNVEEAVYCLGYVSKEEQDLYDRLEQSGFVLHFREHGSDLLGQKKGNVDTDIVFNAMKSLIEKGESYKIVLVSGDGDYKKLVDYLVEKKRLKKILFPNKEYASSLYKQLGSEYYDNLESRGIKSKIALNEKWKGGKKEKKTQTNTKRTKQNEKAKKPAQKSAKQKNRNHQLSAPSTKSTDNRSRNKHTKKKRAP